MIDSKQRSMLKALAVKLQNNVTIGHLGVTDNVLSEIDCALEDKELIKIGILQNSETNAKTLINELCNILGAEPVLVVGRKIVLYRRSKKKGVEHIEI